MNNKNTLLLLACLSALPLHAQEALPPPAARTPAAPPQQSEAAAQPAPASVPVQNLLDIYRLALERDPTWGVAKATYRAQLQQLPQARALLLPNVSGNAEYTDNDVDIQYDDPTVLAGGRRSYEAESYSLNVAQPLYRPQYFAQYRQAQAQVQQAEANLRAAKHDLILRVSQAYFDLLLARNTLEFVRAQKAATAEQLERAKREFELGTVTVVDIHEAQARYDLIIAQEFAAQTDIDVRGEALARIIGVSPGMLAPLPPELALAPPQPTDIEAWVQTGLARNPQLEAQRFGLDIAQLEVRRTRAGHLPTLDLVGSYSDTYQGASTITRAGSDTEATAVGVQLQLPIYQGGGQQARVREARALRERAQETVEGARRDTVLTTREAFLNVTSGIAQVRALEQGVTASELALQSTQRGFEVGVRTAIDVLNAQQQLFNARRDLAQARYLYLVNQLRLKAAAGSLADEDVAELNRLLATAEAPTQ